VLAVLARFSAAFAQDAFFPGDRGAALTQTFRRWSRRSRHERERLTPRTGRKQARVGVNAVVAPLSRGGETTRRQSAVATVSGTGTATERRGYS
jgi:hypothetical protein